MVDAIYRGMDKETLDAAYSNTRMMGMDALIRLGEERTVRSRMLLEEVPAEIDLRYGDGAAHRIDIITAPEGADSPMVAFIHGGYWQGASKEMYNSLASGLLRHRLNFANIEYTLAPAATMGGIVQDIADAVAWLAERRSTGAKSGLYLIGHSAGAHLAASQLGSELVDGVLAISGVYDLEPVQLGAINDRIGMSASDAQLHSPVLHLPSRGTPLLVAVGGDELPELRRQSREYYEAYRSNGQPCTFYEAPRRDHFTILEELEDPAGPIAQAFARMVDDRERAREPADG